MVNAAHLHLIINHFPIIGFAIALVFAIVALFSTDRMLHLATLWLVIGSAATAVLAHLTGDGACDGVKDVAGISQAYMSAHERWGDWTYYAAIGVGVIAAAMLFATLRRPVGSRLMMTFMLVLLLVANGMATVTGTLGGGIRHTEIHSDSLDHLMQGVGLKQEERDMLKDEEAGQPAAKPAKDAGDAGKD